MRRIVGWAVLVVLAFAVGAAIGVVTSPDVAVAQEGTDECTACYSSAYDFFRHCRDVHNDPVDVCRDRFYDAIDYCHRRGGPCDGF